MWPLDPLRPVLRTSSPAALDTERHRLRRAYNTVRLPALIGNVTPDDKHHGRGPAIRRARTAGMRCVQPERIKQNRAKKS
jgi:putative transposase